MYPRGDALCHVEIVRLTETVQTGGLTPHCCMMYTQSSPVDTLNIVKAALPAAEQRMLKLQQQHMQEQHTKLQPY